MKSRKVLTICACAVILFLGRPRDVMAQGGGNATVTSNVNSEATVNAGNNVNYERRQFVQAIPVVTSLFPPYMYPPGTRQLYYPPVYRELTMDEMERMTLKFGASDILFWRKRLHGTLVGASLPANEKPINLVPYWPKNIANPGDKVLGSVIVIGDFLHPEELYLGLVEEWGKKKTGTSRMAICFYEVNESVTREGMIGLGAAGSRITEPGSDNDGASLIVGAGVGKSRGRIEKRIVLEALCLNDGPLTAPSIPKQAEAEVRQEKSAPQASAPTPQRVDVYVHVDGTKAEPTLMQEQAPAMPVPQAAVPAPNPQAMHEACAGKPHTIVLFGFGSADLHLGKYAGPLKEFATWMKANQQCRIQVEGHASQEGSYGFNAELARKRAKAVYDFLVACGVDPYQFASLGKDKSIAAVPSDNRAVIFKVIDLDAEPRR